VYPQGLTELLLRLHQEYAVPPIFITENGAAFPDKLSDGCVADTQRTAYLQQHIAAMAIAMQQGVPIAGYMVWSLMDNFEWASGYAKRFGIVHVDYETQQRTLKDSAKWYRDFLSKQKEAALIGAKGAD
jgi:beta-glucosidase